jgi:hypothetical protein
MTQANSNNFFQQKFTSNGAQPVYIGMNLHSVENSLKKMDKMQDQAIIINDLADAQRGLQIPNLSKLQINFKKGKVTASCSLEGPRQPGARANFGARADSVEEALTQLLLKIKS